VTAVLSAQGLGKRYRRRWALSDCTLDVLPGETARLSPTGQLPGHNDDAAA
jgi:ABC-2 type transport system ATP-binding protein